MSIHNQLSIINQKRGLAMTTNGFGETRWARRRVLRVSGAKGPVQCTFLCKTKPISRFLGLEMGVELKNKANL